MQRRYIDLTLVYQTEWDDILTDHFGEEGWVATDGEVDGGCILQIEP